MRLFTYVRLIGVILSSGLLCQAYEGPLSVQLEALHSKWFAAFDAGDWAAMNQMEMPNLVLIMPNGEIIHKETEPRTGEQPIRGFTYSLDSVSIRRFGKTAILTGVLVTRKGISETREATTVVFVNTGPAWKSASAQWSSRSK